MGNTSVENPLPVSEVVTNDNMSELIPVVCELCAIVSSSLH